MLDNAFIICIGFLLKFLFVDHEDGTLEWMSTPVTFMQSNNTIISPSVKVTNHSTTISTVSINVIFKFTLLRIIEPF